MEACVAGLPRRWKNILLDSLGNVAVLDFYSAFAVTSESNIHFYHIMQNIWCMRMTVIMQIGTSARLMLEIYIINK